MKRSLRTRLLFGTVFWTLGLFLIAGAVLTHVMAAVPSAPQLFHSVFLQVSPIALLAGLFLLLGLTQIRRGVSPISQIRHRLSAVHGGHSRRVEGDFPSEVQPLVDDLNALLTERDRAVERARAKAGDLAHGLKTPLAVLLHEAGKAERTGNGDLAAAIRLQVDRMQRQMDYHLARARAAASGAAPGTRCPVADAAESLARTLRQLHADRHLTIEVAVAPGHAVRTERADFEEMLGNLLDNACKWAVAQVSLSTDLVGTSTVIMIDDDGPGLEDALLESVLQRGVRVDETAPGSGFGLAIVRDLADVYGGAIVLSRSPRLGGLRAQLTLPAA